MNREVPNGFMSVDELMVAVFGGHWKSDPNYLKGREWVRREYYNGGKMPSDREVP